MCIRDRDNIEVGSPLKCNVVVNHHVELSEEEKKAAREAAIKMIHKCRLLLSRYRQNDGTFLELLNRIRENRCDGQVLEALNRRYIPNFVPDKEEGYILSLIHI